MKKRFSSVVGRNSARSKQLGFVINPFRFALSSPPVPTGYPATVLADGASAYWRLGEASGTTVTDSTSNNHNGTYYSSPTLGAAGLLYGDSNTAVTFTGTNYARMPYWSGLNSDVSIELLFEYSGASGSTLVARRSNGSAVDFSEQSWEVRIVGDQVNILIFNAGSNITNMVGATTLTANTKYHIVATIALAGGANGANIYVNGVSDASSTSYAPNQTSSDVMIGANYGSNSVPSEFLTATVDEVAIYPFLLTPTQITAHYNAAVAPLPVTIWDLPNASPNYIAHPTAFNVTNSGETIESAYNGSPSYQACFKATTGITFGKRYFEFLAQNGTSTVGGSPNLSVGVMTFSAAVTDDPTTDAGKGDIWFRDNGQAFYLGSNYLGSFGAWADGDVIGVAIDVGNTISFYRNNALQLSTAWDQPSVTPFCSHAAGCKGTLRTKNSQFTYSPPTGFTGWDELAPISYLLDHVEATVVCAYSNRLLRAGYTGAVLLQKTVSDTTGALVYPDSNGKPNVASMLAYAAGGYSSASWIDQSSNDYGNLTSDTQAHEPSLVVNGAIQPVGAAGWPGLKFDGTSQILRHSDSPVSLPFTRCLVIRFDSITAGQNIVSDSRQNSIYWSADGTIASYAGGSAPFHSGIAVGDIAITMEVLNPGSSQYQYNDSTGNYSPGSSGAFTVALGGGFDGTTAGYFAAITVLEYIIFSAPLTPAQRLVVLNDQRAFYLSSSQSAFLGESSGYILREDGSKLLRE